MENPGTKVGRQPLTIQLEVEFLDRLSEPVREGKARSVSDLIRTAIERFNFENVLVAHISHLMISVRLQDEVRRTLKRVARQKHTSIGHLVRAAVEAYLPILEAMPAGQREMPISPAAEPPLPARPGIKAKPKATTKKQVRKSAKKKAKPGQSARKKRAASRPAMTRKRKG